MDIVEAAAKIEELHRRSGREYTTITQLTHQLDMPFEVIREAVKHLARTTPLTLIPNPLPRTLTNEDHGNAVWFGGQCKHMIG